MSANAGASVVFDQGVRSASTVHAGGNCALLEGGSSMPKQGMVGTKLVGDVGLGLIQPNLRWLVEKLRPWRNREPRI